MISKKKKYSLIIKVIAILFLAIGTVLIIRAFDFHTELGDSSSTYKLIAEELVYAILSAFFIILMLYVLIKKEILEIYYTTQKYALSDALTGLHNRYYLNEYMENFAKSSEDDKEYGVVILNIDYFRKVNDAYGYGEGNCILKELSSKLIMIIDQKGTISRYSGDEFVVVFNNMSKEDISYKAELISYEIESMVFECEKKDITISIGVSTGRDKLKIEQVLLEAELALYMAKKAGKNSVKVYPH